MFIKYPYLQEVEETSPTPSGGSGENTTSESENLDTSFLNGGEGENAEGTPPAEGTPAEGESAEGEKPAEGTPKEYTDEDYINEMTIDTSLIGDNKEYGFDADIVKAMLPTAKELGIAPAAMNKLANALAKAQIDAAKDKMAERIKLHEKDIAVARQTYTQKDFSNINKAIDHFFKPNGTMNYVIRNSELGSDPEFLRLMHTLSSRMKEDGIAGAGAGSTDSSIDPNSTEGLSKLW